MVHVSIMAGSGFVMCQNLWRIYVPEYFWYVNFAMDKIRWPVALTGGYFGLIVGQFMRDGAFPSWYNNSLLILTCASWFQVGSRYYRDPFYSHPLGPKHTSLNHFAFGTMIGLTLQFAPFVKQMMKQ